MTEESTEIKQLDGRDYRFQEYINICRNVVCAGKKEGERPDKEYNLVSDNIDESGNRVIVLKPRDTTDFMRLVNEAVSMICESLGEEGKTLRLILKDELVDWTPDAVSRLIKKLKGNKAGIKPPIKSKPGCVEIIIGDGRRRNHSRISLRN